MTGSNTRPRALSIAGSDSGGGAGIQADLKTFSAFGVFGMTAITAVTVQNTLGVQSVEAISPGTVADQVRAVASDIGVDAAKTGMLANALIVEAVADVVAETAIPNLVVDPVFVSKHGHVLLPDDAVGALRTRILPLATIVTPNLPGSGSRRLRRRDPRPDAAGRRCDPRPGGQARSLVKGGHLEDSARSDDLFVGSSGEGWLEGERIDTPNTHGTGCTLSAAIAARLALGDDVPDAVRAAKAFVTEAIRHALTLGGGIGPVDPMWAIRSGRPDLTSRG
jgi:hydroxymethylpyrimidine/phosphomethylpyrimidine kinase